MVSLFEGQKIVKADEWEAMLAIVRKLAEIEPAFRAFNGLPGWRCVFCGANEPDEHDESCLWLRAQPFKEK